ncbi:hypothetical protein [Arsukibacterium sp.]|uniref:hypothetical protein n=1 Tax=Arsukibacterium sp. TaxID=1977258 RepID=UPI002FDABC98
MESQSDFDKLLALPQLQGIAPLNSILLPENLDSIKSLREAAARLKADILVIYTFNTSFHVAGQRYAPLNVISLGFLKNKEVSVTTTVSAAFFDVRTEYLYGLSEATDTKNKHSSIWSSSADVDDLRLATEKQAFAKLIPELEKTWAGIVKHYSNNH